MHEQLSKVMKVKTLTVGLLGVDAKLIVTFVLVIRVQSLCVDISINVEGKSLVRPLRVSKVDILGLNIS